MLAAKSISKNAVLHHLFGIGGQVAAAAPILIISIILSHTAGLVVAGQFVIAAGVSAIIFTIAFLGSVYYVVVDRLREFDSRDFSLTRLSATLIAVALLFVLSGQMGIPFELVLLIALLRVADAAVDMAWGLDLLREPTRLAMQRYAILNGAKLAVVVIPAALAVLFGMYSLPVLIASTSVAAAACWLWLFRISWGQRPRQPFGTQAIRSLRLARGAVWFTVGASVCAGATSAPRLLIDDFYTGDTMGIVGVTLAFSTLFAMAFMSSWLRWFPRLSKAPEGERKVGPIVLESLLMGLFFLLVNSTVTPWIVAALFGFDPRADQEVCKQVLLASTIFSFAMNMANLFKLTSAVWLETAAYVAAIFGGLFFVTIAPTTAVPGFLLAASLFMLLVVCTGMSWANRRSARSVALARSKRAVFLRLASRPVPRVMRMMRVAREAGYDPIFVGAFREKGLPARDSWEGFTIYRVGGPFPLLNGTKLWLYLRSVVSCNWGFFAIIRHERPDVVHASDFETMPAAILYRLTHNCRLVYNIHDNLGQRYMVPRPIASTLNALEGVAVLLADHTLVPETFRRNGLPRWCQDKVGVIRNVPPDYGSAPPPPFENGQIRLFYGGWLDWQRGLEALLRLAREPDIELRIAGEGAPEIIKTINSISSVTYLGFIDSQAVLEETSRCHFVPVLYDPSRIGNRFAASNKLAEALSIGRPMILNEELEIAKELKAAPCIINTKYDDIATVITQLRALAADPEQYASACANARATYEAHYNWTEIKDRSLRALTGEAPASSYPVGQQLAGL